MSSDLMNGSNAMSGGDADVSPCRSDLLPLLGGEFDKRMEGGA